MAHPRIHKRTTAGTTEYYATVDVGKRPDGTRIQRRRAWPTRKEAEHGLAAWLVEIQTGRYVERTPRTLAEAMADWLAYMGERVEPNTLSGYRITCVKHIAPILGPLDVARVTPGDIDRLYSALRAAGRSPRVVFGCHLRLRQVYKFALRRGYADRDPTAGVDAPRLPRTERVPLTRAEARTLLAATAGSGLHPLWLTALHTGMRIGELLALRWRDVDLDGGVAVVRHAQIVEKGGRRVKGPKGDKARGFALSPQTAAALAAHRTRQKGRRVLLGAAWRGPTVGDEMWVFCGAYGDRLHPETVRSYLKRACREAGLPVVTPHILRHTYATHLVDAGAPLKTLAARLGHASERTTLGIYAHAVAERDRETAALSDALFGPADGADGGPDWDGRGSDRGADGAGFRPSVNER